MPTASMLDDTHPPAGRRENTLGHFRGKWQKSGPRRKRYPWHFLSYSIDSDEVFGCEFVVNLCDLQITYKVASVYYLSYLELLKDK